MRGVVAAGHPLTAEAGAEVLRAGGNAVDAAVCAVLTSFAVESPLTGFGAGGFMLVHRPAGSSAHRPAGSSASRPGPAGALPGSPESVLIDFFVEAPGREGTEPAEALLPIDVYFDQTPQTFNVGPASCGVPGTAAGLAHALERFGTMPMQELIKPAVGYARDGVLLNRQQAYIFHILDPILTHFEESRALYAPQGRILREGETFRFPELADALERYASEGPAPFYSGAVGEKVADWVSERGGTLSRADMAAYGAIEREPVRAAYRGTTVLTNPPPSSGGILIALSLDLLDRLGASGVEELVSAMRAANEQRGEEFSAGLYEDGYLERFLEPARVERIAERIRTGSPGGEEGQGEALGSTTHLSVIDADGACAACTCSNGSGSGVLVPATGVHVNNMLGEEDLNPLGFHRTPPGKRMPSMMAPTVVLREGEVSAALGSAGSNRIRSAILQTIIRLIDEGLEPGPAIEAGRIHFEAGVVQAEPGVDEDGLAAVEEHGTPVVRWQRPNLYFGGVQAAARDREGRLSGGGDPRRGGAVVVVD